MTYPGTIGVSVYINDVDVSGYIQWDTLHISSVITKQVDTADFTLEVAQALSLSKWDEVEVYDGGTSGTKLFGGYLLNTVEYVNGIDLDIDCRCSDYSVLLTKPIVKEEFTGSNTDQDIIDDLFTEYLPEINSTTYVDKLKTWSDGIRFNRKNLWECMDILAGATGGDWYVDENKNLHYFYNEENSAPYSISDNPDFTDSFPGREIKKEGDGSDIVNRIEVVGGNYLSDDAYLFLKGTGQDNKVIMPFKYHAPTTASALQVWRNDGTDTTASWTALTVKVGYIDDLTTASEVLHYFNDKVLEAYNNWPNLERAVRVYGRYEVPLLVRLSDDVSRDAIGQTIYFDDVIVDNTIISIPQAKLRALGRLAELNLEKISITFTALEPGLKAGQIIHITNSILGLNDEYLIYRVSGAVNNNGYGSYEVEAGVYSEELVDFMIAIAKDRRPQTQWREDEVLNEFLSTAEVLTLSESSSYSTTNTSGYTWGVDADDFLWSFGRWS